MQKINLLFFSTLFNTETQNPQRITENLIFNDFALFFISLFAIFATFKNEKNEKNPLCCFVNRLYNDAFFGHL